MKLVINGIYLKAHPDTVINLSHFSLSTCIQVDSGRKLEEIYHRWGTADTEGAKLCYYPSSLIPDHLLWISINIYYI
jgi:hypothetical protein